MKQQRRREETRPDQGDRRHRRDTADDHGRPGGSASFPVNAPNRVPGQRPEDEDQTGTRSDDN